jgi:hypothetical protein
MILTLDIIISYYFSCANSALSKNILYSENSTLRQKSGKIFFTCEKNAKVNLFVYTQIWKGIMQIEIFNWIYQGSVKATVYKSPQLSKHRKYNLQLQANRKWYDTLIFKYVS